MQKQKSITQHFTFCCSVIFLFALYSVILDQYYFTIDYGEDNGILSSFSYYIFYIIIVYFPFWIIIAVFYNWIAVFGFEKMPHKNIIRVMYGAIIGFIVGLAFRKIEGSFYIGSFRPQRNIILFTLVGLSAELLRIIFSYYAKKWTKKEVA